jgi:hypothetical protein
MGTGPHQPSSYPHRRYGSWGQAHHGSTWTWGRAYPYSGDSNVQDLQVAKSKVTQVSVVASGAAARQHRRPSTPKDTLTSLRLGTYGAPF